MEVEKREPYTDADGYTSNFERWAAEAKAQDARMAAIKTEFLKAVQTCRAADAAPWAPKVRDHNSTGVMRWQTVGEVVYETTDASQHDFLHESMQLLLDAAKSSDIDLASRAGDLLERMAGHYAWINIE